MKITSLKKYKGSTYEAELDYDRKIYLHIEIIADFGLREGDEIERERLREVIYASNFRRAYQRSLYLLDVRDYSRREIFGKLISTYKSEKLCNDVCDRLEEFGMINDQRYAEKLAAKYVTVKRFGFFRAKREMMQRGLDKFTVEDALTLHEDEYKDNVMHLLKTKYAGYLTDPDERRDIERVKATLARYGYGFDIINLCIREYFDE